MDPVIPSPPPLLPNMNEAQALSAEWISEVLVVGGEYAHHDSDNMWENTAATVCSVSINTQGQVLINMFTSLPPSFSLSVCPFPSFFRAPPPPPLFPFPLFFSQTSLYPASAQTLFPSERVPALFVLPSSSQQLCYNPTPPGAHTRSTEIKTETDGECLSYSSGGRSVSRPYFDLGNI